MVPQIVPRVVLERNAFLDRSSVFNVIPNHISSPIQLQALALLLVGHPDQGLVQFLIQGFIHGFDIGFVGTFTATYPRNLLSARNEVQGVSRAIQTELRRGHTAGPFSVSPFEFFHCSPLGAVPKSDSSFRLILDLSSPRGQSINEGISQEKFSVVYSRFDDAVDIVRELGAKCFMGKLDVKHAFRLCPVRPEDFPLLGFSWQGQYYFELRLPFGSRSSPFIFNSLAAAVCFIFVVVFGVHHVIHYLDDYFVANSDQPSCSRDMDTIIHVFATLGIPVALDKLIGPLKCITYLGIEIDAMAGIVRLPESKLPELQLLLSSWLLRSNCTKRELLSLIGKLSFAAKVVKPGRLFLRRLIDLSTTVSRLGHHIHLNKEAKADLTWWHEFLIPWNGVAIIHESLCVATELELATDACLNIGCGGTFGNHWFHDTWPQAFKDLLIAPKELFAILAAVYLWKDDLSNKQIILHTDNMACYQVWRFGVAKDPNMMRFMRPLFSLCASHNINLLLHHIPGHDNVLADLLSRSLIQKFREAHPLADLHPTPIPPVVWTF